MLVTLLKLVLIDTRAVGTAAQALSLIQTERFDVYLLDARLPDLNGFELCRRMRADDPHTPILFFSGAAYAADMKRGIEAGANAYVIKPELDVLVRTLSQFIPQAEEVRVIPFKPKVNFSPGSTFGAAA
jgi:DNA-binding response OmpR family regulator